MKRSKVEEVYIVNYFMDENFIEMIERLLNYKSIQTPSREAW